LAIAAFIGCAPLVAGQAFPIQVYDVAQGLPSSRVACIQQDSRGYLWFGTWDGLSRFDGFEFKNYGLAEGLPSTLVNSIVETPWGELWVGTHGGGFAIYTPERKLGSRSLAFRTVSLGADRSANQVNAFLFDGKGRVWIGTQGGLYRGERDARGDWQFAPIRLGAPIESPQHALATVDGRLWFAFPNDLLEIDGEAKRDHTVPAGDGAGVVQSICDAGDGSLFVARDRSVDRCVLPSNPGGSDRWESLGIARDPEEEFHTLLRDSAGQLWIGSTQGLLFWNGERIRRWSEHEGLPDSNIRAIFEDRERNLWFATLSAGVCRRSPADIANYTPVQGLPVRIATQIVEASDGRIYAATTAGTVEVDDDRVWIVEGSLDPPFQRAGRSTLQDRCGDWWVGTPEGLYRFRGKDLRFRDGERLGVANGLPDRWDCGKLVQDRAGRIVALSTAGPVYVSEPDPGEAPRFEPLAEADSKILGFPRECFVTSAGNLWFAHWLAPGRLRGRAIEPLPNFPGGPIVDPRCICEDRAGNLWFGTRQRGAWCVADPESPNPTITRFTTENGLPSDAVFSIAEDHAGNLWFGTSRGLARLDPKNRVCDLLQTSDGLAGDIVYDCHVDASGILWVATSGGVSRIDPVSIAAHPEPPDVILTSIEADGEMVPIPDTGARRVDIPNFPPSTSRVSIAYTAIAPRGARQLEYQFRVGDSPWSPPTRDRSIQLAALAAGDHRFEVRAAGEPQRSEPATVSFRIPPPIWQRAWFLAIVGICATGGALAIHRARVRRLLALERIRRQIATDIHDELGAGLSQIAILSEVGKRDATASGRARLDDVADLARSLRDSMSDIVWALDPRRDRASDLVSRMRQFAFGILDTDGRAVEFRAPPESETGGLRLEPDQKRQLFLFFKEALHNASRHSRAANVGIDVELHGDELRLLVKDDGVGFDPRAEHAGHGLGSLAERARNLGAQLSIESAPGRGAAISLVVPLRAHPRILMRG
jgi:ligand-binding sensor domain-containing protein/signal transduction histidine kinase